MKLVLIEWVDSMAGHNGWECLNELESLLPARPTSVGFILEEIEDYITLVQTVDDTQILGRITIPKHCILDIFPIPDPRERDVDTKLREGAP